MNQKILIKRIDFIIKQKIYYVLSNTESFYYFIILGIFTVFSDTRDTAQCKTLQNIENHAYQLQTTN